VTVRDVLAKTILSASKVYDYALNPFTGCEHACSYCYARYMKRFTGHRDPWGSFVDIKVNAPELLSGEVRRKKPGSVWVSGVCDPYQPLEAHYELTRACLEILVRCDWPVRVQTRSPLVTRDVDILKRGTDLEVGFSIATADDRIRTWFEPAAPSIPERLEALDELRRNGVRTFVMVAPLLPGAEELGRLLAGRTDHVLIDRMNYGYGAWVYRKHGLEGALTDEFFRRTAESLRRSFEAQGMPCRVLF
jgi:DNA repair photolyase